MATLYFKLEQIATVGSPTTGSTVYMAWPDTSVPAGNDQTYTVNFLTNFPNSTWAFRSRTWKVTNLGSTPIPFDTQMITGEPWNATSTSLVPVYVGFTFNINTTFFAQNYIDVQGSSGTFKSPRYITNFYSANTFNNTLKVIGTDTNRYDYIFPTTANDYNHITNNGVLNYDFNSSTIITYDITPGTSNYGLIPETATSAVNYFNGLYDGWTSDVDDCFGNIITDSTTRVRYVGDLHDRSESFASKWGGPCLRVNDVQTPYSGTPSSGFDEIVLAWYTDCSDCQTTNPFNNIYKFTADDNCSGVSQGLRVFSASTLTWGSPLGGGSVTPQFVQIKSECFGGETGPADQVLISAVLLGDPIDSVYNSCVDCENDANPIDEYYYFSACSTNKIFRFNVIDFDNDFSSPGTFLNTYLFENVGGVNGCFTYISDPLGNPFVTITYWDNSVATVSGIKCTDVLCQQFTPTPTPTPTLTPTLTPTITPTSSPSFSPTPTITPTNTPTPSPSVATKGGLSDKLNSCEVTSQSQKVFVFYDGSSLNENTASIASESIRSWYQTKVTNGDLTLGNLYEGIIGENSDNGENWLWWASYPYLGSLTGGTLSDNTQINEFNSPVTNSIYSSQFCSSNVGGECVPKSVQFNDENQTLGIFRRINRGYQLTGSYGVVDLRSNGVPFDHNDLDFSSTSGPGTFSGEESNYIVIFVIDESDSAVGLYTGTINKSQHLYEFPFRLEGTYWVNSNVKEYTNRYQYDYESYLKVWEDIQNNNGQVNGLVYPVANSNLGPTPAFVLHSVASSEGDTISTGDFLINYGENITSVGPYNLNLSALTNTNVYSGLTSSTAYQNLSPNNQNGAGLKHFGILSDPTVVSFNETVVTGSLDSFLNNIETPLNVLYVAPGNRNINEVYNLSGDCYTVELVNVNPPVPLTNVTNQTGPFSDCNECETTGCFSGITDGFFTFTDCCGVIQQGNQVGLEVCVDTTYSIQGVQMSIDPCVPDCDEGPLDYIFEVTGACENRAGTIMITPLYGTKPYTITNISTTAPGGILLLQQTGNGPFTWFGVDEGNYVFELQDSSGGVNQNVFINVNVDGCFTAEIINVSGTTCGDLQSGILTVTNDSLSSPYQIDLYAVGVGLVNSINSPVPSHTFNSLFANTYYAIVTDFGGATAQTNNAVIVSSSEISFTTIVVDDSPCTPGFGNSTVTSVSNGTPPYTYLWADGQTGVTATGLTQGTWSIMVTDDNGCSSTQNVTVGLAPNLGIVSVTPVNANCFSCDGALQLTVSGGTPPYTFVNNTGQQGTTNNTTFNFNGLCAGPQSVIVTDFAGCQITEISNIQSTAGFTVVSVNVTNSDCNDDGSIFIQITAPIGLYTYSVTDSNGSTQTITTGSLSHTFSNLVSGVYDVEISSQNGLCSYTTQETITNVPKFTVNIDITGTTCGGSNGIIEVDLTAGSVALDGPFDYILTDINSGFVIYSQIDDPSSTVLINSLSPSTYLLEVTDSKNCTVSQNITISQSTGVSFFIQPTECVTGNDGVATINITQGVAPFTILWSNGGTTTSINGLGAGTYDATVTDDNGCSLTESVTINCNNQIVECYEVNEICENDFITTSAGIRDFGSMLNEGYLDLTVGHQNCTLVNAVFYAIVDFSGGTMTPPYHVELPFYTSIGLNDYPSAQEWIDAIDEILKTIPQIESFTLDINQNLITIISDCKELKDVYFRLSTKIVYDICCNDVPTPTPTPTNTPTPTITPTVTPTQPVVAIPCDNPPNIPPGAPGRYDITYDVGNDPDELGAIIVYFNPAGIPDGVRVQHNGNFYNRLYSPTLTTTTPLQSPNGNMAFTTLGNNAPFASTTTNTYNLNELSNTNPAVWLPNGTTTATYTTGDYLFGGANQWNLIVIPKTNVSATSLLVESVGWNGGTVFTVDIECPAPLPSFSGVSGTKLCSIATEEYYFARFRNQSNTFPAQNNPVFTDPNGQNVFSPGAGNATDISMSNGNVITVTDGMVTNIVACT